MVFGFNTIGRRIEELETEQAAVQAALPGMSEGERAYALDGSGAVHREVLIGIYKATLRDGGHVGLIDTLRPNRLWPVGSWTASQRHGFNACLGATAFLFPDGPVRSSYLE